MPAVLSIEHHDGTFTEIELGGVAKAYLRVVPEGLMLRWEGVRGNRTVYPWAAIRCYTIETEAGRSDRERIEKERIREHLHRHYAWKPSGTVGGRGDVPERAPEGGRGPQGGAAGGPV